MKKKHYRSKEGQRIKDGQKRKGKRMRSLNKNLKHCMINRTEYGTVYRERYGEKLNADKQNRHIYGHKSVKENAGYFKNDLKTLQQIVNEKAGTGEIYFSRNELVEIIEDVRLKGYDFSIVFKKHTPTNASKIHYSKKGVHIVPFFDYKKDK